MVDNPKTKIAIVGVSSLILAATVVAIVFVTINDDKGKKNENSTNFSASRKAITSLCESTDYQKACIDSLSGKNTDDPKELIELSFLAAIQEIEHALKDSSVLREIATDARGKSALEDCRELAGRAVNDLRRSFHKFQGFDLQDITNTISDLKVWLSGAVTYQETCLDGFEGVPGDAGKKMREVLTKAMQMTSNGLAMVTVLSSVIDTVGESPTETGPASRRLLWDENAPRWVHQDGFPDWVDPNMRRMLGGGSTTGNVKPDAVVAQDGSGNYRTIKEALEKIPKKREHTFVLYIKEGVYKEKVQINSSMTHLMMVGDGPTKTRITGNLNYIDGTNTYHTATVAVSGDHFMAKDIGFENSAGPEKHQAVALRVSADMAIFYGCHMDGYQDTLYAHTYRQFYRDCRISGTIDFVFGDSAAVLQGCTLIVRKPLENQKCIVTAQGRKEARQPTGLVLQNCSFVADSEYLPVKDKSKAYLGRPWKEFSRTIIMESFLDEFIQPEGWLPWNENFALKTLFYVEFNNRGPASPKSNRVKWPGVKELPAKRVQRFTAERFINGNRWVKKNKHTHYDGGFMFPVPKEDPSANYSAVVSEENKDLGGSDSDNSSSWSNDSVSGPVSQTATSPWMQPHADAPAPASETNSYVAAPAPALETNFYAVAPVPSSETNSYAAAPAPALSPDSPPNSRQYI